ncbi:MAG: SDR family oxidoreductase, partial [Terriglobia bacterium]
MADKGAVVITGASTGIGEACALHLDKLGFRVFAGIRKAADAEALRHRASARLVPIRLDVSDETEVEQAARNVTEALRGEGLAGLVNNAGIVVAGMLEFLPLDALRRQLEVNVVGQVAVTQAFLPHLRKARGRIVNIGSVSGLIAGPFSGAYAASKFALEALTDALRVELRPWKIHVSIVEPGNIQTPIWK